MYPRYALALKATSKVSDISLPSATRSRLDRHSHKEDVDFVVSQKLITAGNGSHTLHTWLDKRADAEHKAASLKHSTSTLTRFTLSKASARLHKRDMKLAMTTPSAITNLSSSSAIKCVYRLHSKVQPSLSYPLPRSTHVILSFLHKN